MIRLLTATAFALMLAAPVMAQSVSPGEQQEQPTQRQGGTALPGSPQSNQIPGLSGQAPTDCLPNDPRPACQTAQLPSQEPGSSSTITPSAPVEREGSSGTAVPSQPYGSSEQEKMGR